DKRVVFSEGFGFADKQRKIPSAPDTVYRCGSISKLFTATATMQLAEQGRLDIDAPVPTYLPSFSIIDPLPGNAPITLRQLMCHRSGLVREAPVGGYLDPNGPTPEATVASLASCVRVHPPGVITKYSNSGVTVVGQTVAAVAGVSFAEYQRAKVLEPLGMKSSGWVLDRKLKRRFAAGYLPVADGKGGFREIATPHFELGTVPAGNLYTTCEDLSLFVRCLFNGGQAGNTQLLKPETIEQMFTPQLTTNRSGFGHGFSVGKYRAHKSVSHSGAVYGFSSSLVALPELKLAAIVLANDDVAMGPVRRLSNQALDILLAVKQGETRPKPKPTFEADPDFLKACEGFFESESYWAEVKVNDNALRINMSGQRMALRPVGNGSFEANGRVAHRSPAKFNTNKAGKVTGFTLFGRTFVRTTTALDAVIPESWEKFLGSYGADFVPLIITARHGHLYAMTENFFDYRLTPMNGSVFKMPPGMYINEELVFQQDKRGRVHTAVLANMPLKRSK
ncbi:MAG: serine hydrolase domain-containing protein, partial [Limisphaerales bacterium]